MQFLGLTILKFSAINNCLFVKYLELVPLFNSSNNFFFTFTNTIKVNPVSTFLWQKSSIYVSVVPVSSNTINSNS